MYYNNSKINQNDRVVMYIQKDLIENTNIIEIGRLVIQHSKIKLNESNTIEVSVVYRSHNLTEFIVILKHI